MSQKRLGSFADFKSGNYSGKEFVFVLNHINQNPSFKSGRGQGVHYPPSVRVLLYDEIFDKEANRQRVIRYIPGETSIYMDEQSSDDKIAKRNFHLEFINGDKRVDGTQTLLIKYLMLTNKNGSNPNRDKSVNPRFFTVDPGEGLKVVMDSDELLSEAQHFCYKGDWDEVAAYSMVLGIPLDRDAREIRYSLRMIASNDPKKFMDGLKSPKMKRKYFVMEALREGIIVRNPANNTVSWKDGGVITQAPIGKDLIEDFVDATFTPNGEKVFSAIMGVLRPETSSPKIATELTNIPAEVTKEGPKFDGPVVPQVVMADISDAEVDSLIERAEAKGVITYAAPFWFKFNGKSYKKKEALSAALKGDPFLVAELKKQLN